MSAHVNEDLTALLDGELAGEERERVEAHLKECPACAAERDVLKAALGLMQVPAIEPSADLRRRVLNAVDAEPVGLLARLRGLVSLRFLVPAAAALGAAAVLFVGTYPNPALEDLEVAERLDLLQDYDVVATAFPADIPAGDMDVVANLHELGE